MGNFFQDLGKNVGQGTVEEARRAVDDALDRLQPMLDNLFNRATVLVHNILNRFEVDIKIKLNPWNPPPKEY